MVSTSIGIVELLVLLLVALLSLALPAAIVFLLYKIYVKLKEIEDQLRKK